MNQNLAAVLGIRLAFDETSGLQPVRQLYNRVMPQDQPAGQLADGGPLSRGQPLERQQRLMVLRFKIVLSGLYLAEMKELPELVSKLRQIPVIA